MKLLIILLLSILNNVIGEPNVVFIVTDDQDLVLDGMLSMKNTVDLVGHNGKTFQNAFVNTPVCCPSRSTILTGKFIHNTGVFNNSIAGNCSSREWQQKQEPNTIANILKNTKDYVTFYGGKYMNQYGTPDAGGLKHVPVGYDWWVGLQRNSQYLNYNISINGTAVYDNKEYLTDALVHHSINFLDNRPKESPFFMMICPPAPHAPFTPAKRHEDKYEGTKVLRTPSFNVSGANKHWLIRMTPEYLPENVTILDQVREHRLESLLAVDELVETVVQKLKSQNILDNTYVIFTSDNGFHIGQFSQPWDKRQPYETDIRVPFLISGPKIPKKTKETFPISAVDIAPTILDILGVKIPKTMDGKSFKEKLFSNKATTSYKETIYIEYSGEGNNVRIDAACPQKVDPDVTECVMDQWCKCQDARNNTYSCILDLKEKQTFKFCQFYDKEHFVEAYNLTADPYELDNLAETLTSATSKKYLGVMEKFQKCKGQDCQKISL